MLKERVKNVLPRGWRARVRRLSRLRWLTKIDVLRYSGVGWSDIRWAHIAYVAWDPEVESHTYDVANVAELAEFIADLVGVGSRQVLDHLEAGIADPCFNRQWRRRMRYRFDVKHRAMLGNRLLWWGLVRTTRPELCVECGIYNGFGSMVLLRALQLNADDGHEGALIGVDTEPSRSWVVPPELAENWTTVVGRTTDVLDSALQGRAVGMLVHDTPHTFDNAHHEFAVAIRHASTPLVLVDSSGGHTTALADLCRAHGGRYAVFQDVPANHFRTSSGTAVGYFPAPASAPAPVESPG